MERPNRPAITGPGPSDWLKPGNKTENPVNSRNFPLYSQGMDTLTTTLLELWRLAASHGRLDEVISTLESLFPGGELHEYDNKRTGAPLLYVYFADIPDVSGES